MPSSREYMRTALTVTCAMGVAVAVVLSGGEVSGFSEPIPTKISLLKWRGSPPVGNLYKLVSKAPNPPLFQLPTPGATDPVTLGGSLKVGVGVGGAAGRLSCILQAGTFDGTRGWNGLGNPAGSTGYKYRNKGAPGSDPCKIVIIKEKVIKVLAKSVGEVDPPVGFPPGNPDVKVFLAAGADEYCAAASAPHFKEKADTLIQMKDQSAPASCARCGDQSVNQPGEECDGIDDRACPGSCIAPGAGGRCGDNLMNGGAECTCATEQCDGADAGRCPGLCFPNCTCPEPICSNGVKEVGEGCDPPGSATDCPEGEICGGFCACVDDVPCDCGSPDPTVYMYRDLPPIPDSNCGSVDGSALTDLKCMGLYIGGGGGALPVPNMVPDQGMTKYTIPQCYGTNLTLGPATRAQVGPRHCSEGKKCVGGPNDGEPCVRDRDCDNYPCGPRCWFGSYLAVLDVELPPLSTCVGNEMAGDNAGGLDCETGEAFTRIPIDSRVHLTLVDQSPSTPGHNPCPVCVGGVLDVAGSGVCEGGPNNGQPCMPMSTSYDRHDCCAGGLNNSKPCADDTDCPGSTCASGCTTYPTSLDCPPHPLTDIGGLLLSLKMNTEGPGAYDNSVEATAEGEFCGWCRDIEVEGTGCFEGDADDGPPAGGQGCPDSSVIACRPTTFYGVGGGDPADMAECGDPLPCRGDGDCTAPYETCTQRNPGAWRDATVRNVSYYSATRPGDLRDRSFHPSTIVTNFCIPANFVESVDGQSDLGGPGGLSLVGEARLSPSEAFVTTTGGLFD